MLIRERTRNHLISTMAPGFRRFAALRCVTEPDRYIKNDLGMRRGLKYHSESYQSLSLLINFN